MAQGGLLPDEMVLKVVTSKLDKLHNKVHIYLIPILEFVRHDLWVLILLC